MSSSHNGKAPKASKSAKNKKGKADLEFSCKFRGKYDLNKNKKNKEINLENAVNLFEVIYKKNENLFKDTNIKMFKEKKSFSFADPNSFSKIHHRVPYIQVRKFFVLHKDPTMVIMGVNHKSHRWFLVFQFANTEDLRQFCDEIEGAKKHAADYEDIGSPTVDEYDSKPIDVPEILVDGEVRSDSPEFDNSKNDNFERMSIHSEMYIANLKTENNDFTDSYYEPDLEPENVLSESSFIEEASPSLYSSRASSRNSLDSDFDDKVYCDNFRHCKLKDLLMGSDHVIFPNSNDWTENLTCMEYPKEYEQTQYNKIGPVYIYSARHKVISNRYSGSYSSDDEDKNAKKSTKGNGLSHNHIQEGDKFHHHGPKLIC